MVFSVDITQSYIYVKSFIATGCYTVYTYTYIVSSLTVTFS